MDLLMLYTFAVLTAAPYPVQTPQPRRQTLSRGAAGSILATANSLTTVYSVKVPVPENCNSFLPLHLNLDAFCREVPVLEQNFSAEKWESKVGKEWTAGDGCFWSSPCFHALVGQWALTEVTFSTLADGQRDNFVS